MLPFIHSHQFYTLDIFRIIITVSHAECMWSMGYYISVSNQALTLLLHLVFNMSICSTADPEKPYLQKKSIVQPLIMMKFSHFLIFDINNPHSASFLFHLSHHHLSGVNAISKEVTGPKALVKHSLLSDRQIESPPKRPKSAEGKTSANEQVRVWIVH